MRLRRRLMPTLAGLAIALGLATLGLRLYFDRAAEDQLRDNELVDFSARGSAGRLNVFALCPPRFCTPDGDAESPAFEVPWQRLRAAWEAMIATQDRVVEVAADGERRRLTYIQHTRLLRFPDVVTVVFVPLGENRSTIAVDSRSRYGRGDMGANRRRVEGWLALLRQRVG